MNRRLFLLGSAATITSVTIASESKELAVDVAIIGGGLGGVAAAIGACRGGAKKVLLTEETTWIGGQLTSQLVPPDEHKFIEGGGSTKSYQDLRNSIREVYRTRKDKPLTAAAKTIKNLNPGNGWVSRLCHEPSVALGVMESMLKPYIASGQLTVLLKTKLVGADIIGDAVRAVTLEREGKKTTITAKYFLDATEEGDLLPMTKTEYVTGTESQKETGEPNAADKPRPGNIQSFTWCAVLEHRPGEEHIIEKPKDYDFWKQQTYDKAPVFQWEKPAYSFYPLAEKDPKQPKLMNFWTYRRILAKNQFTTGSYPGDVTVINYHQNDYAQGSSHFGKPDDCAKHLAAAKELTRCFIHWLQTESPRSDGKTGWPDLKLGASFTGTPDGIAMSAYIRESRRIVPEFRILQQHVSYDLKVKELGKEKARAEEYKDSIGVGHYLYFDLHKTCEGYSNGGGGKVFPFRIPMGAIIPQRVTNLLAACKNLGVTHITNGCYRLHPTEWNVGESAGALAAYCLAMSVTPKQVRNTPARLADYQTSLTKAGMQLEWPASQVQEA